MPPVKSRPRGYLFDERRISIISTHRQVRHLASQYCSQVAQRSIENEGRYNRPLRTLEMLPTRPRLTQITLADMERRRASAPIQDQDELFKGTWLRLTIIDEPCFGKTSGSFIVEDENKNIIRLAIVDRYHRVVEKLVFGRVIAIVNPCLGAGADGETTIEVVDLETIYIIEKKRHMCRFCGKENTAWACDECDKRYCSRECQVADWMYYKHDLVCSGGIRTLRAAIFLIVFGVQLLWLCFTQFD